MPSITTKQDLTSTTIQIRSDDAKSNFLNFEQRWESTSAIRVFAKINKVSNFDELYQDLTIFEKDYINLVCNSIKFNKPVVYYLPDWIFLSKDGNTVEDVLSKVLVELFTGLGDESQNLFKIDIIELNLDPGVEIGFPVE